MLVLSIRQAIPRKSTDAFANLLEKSRYVEWLAVEGQLMDRCQTLDEEPEGAKTLSSTHAKPARRTTSEEKLRCGRCQSFNHATRDC